MRVERRAYSKSWVALKAMSIRDMNRNTLLLNNTLRRSGMTTALPEKRPWYRMMRENRTG